MTSHTPDLEAEAGGRLTGILDGVREIASGDRVRLRDIVEGFGRTSFLPLLLIPALLVVTPLSGIPFFSSICGLTIALVALQMVFRRKHLWLPAALLNRHISSRRLRSALDRIAPAVAWIDRHSRDRWRLLVREPTRTVAEFACACAGGVMPLLELVPFSSSILGAAVSLIAVGFLAHDGLYVVLSVAFLAVGASIPIFIIV